MAQVKLFGGLQRKAGTTAVTIPGSNIQALLQNLFVTHPELETAVTDDQHHLQPHVRVMVNGHDIELGDGLETAVTDQDVIAIFPPIAGG
ncbi:MAG: MoaD family protein [Anaerolineae bacterium]|nr:MoaD family protein [Anaerolineae bacterium]